ncbi:molybdate ABC transporter substrate-binding protein [Roseateles koreensis]|uniref:Molybdate ABC transporter substrate-binding protein n=1 Tax=Roseateles koreensis TaxID=2987526 RepID=A0ABT5KPR4_9BURK|nr:molybdate ABC transporter substrate-binding protein [Roseateles koreensis]MDC8784857.1 molybdate ABC transporter substrate-binding protein [Roseateles koreensis]
MSLSTAPAAKALRWAAVIVALMSGARIAQGAEMTVAAASSLSNAFKEMAPAFEAQHPGTQLLFNFAASDALLAQIAKGAHIDVFASADQDAMDRAEAQQLVQAHSRLNFAGNTLVLITPITSTLTLKTLSDLKKPEVAHLAMGMPEGVPAGRYAKSALEVAGLWSTLSPKALYARNVRQALDHVARGEAEAGFVYSTDAASLKRRVKVAFPVPTYAPIHYPAAVVAGSPNAERARQFINYLRSSAGQAVLTRHGFLPP